MLGELGLQCVPTIFLFFGWPGLIETGILTRSHVPYFEDAVAGAGAKRMPVPIKAPTSMDHNFIDYSLLSITFLL
jgi:hypothetical protein